MRKLIASAVREPEEYKELAALRARVAELETLLAHATEFRVGDAFAREVRPSWWRIVNGNSSRYAITRAESLAAIGLRDPVKDGAK